MDKLWLFESLLHPLVIMLCIPFALLGVIWILALTHTPLNIPLVRS